MMHGQKNIKLYDKYLLSYRLGQCELLLIALSKSANNHLNYVQSAMNE